MWNRKKRNVKLSHTCDNRIAQIIFGCGFWKVLQFSTAQSKFTAEASFLQHFWHQASHCLMLRNIDGDSFVLLMQFTHKSLIVQNIKQTHSRIQTFFQWRKNEMEILGIRIECLSMLLLFSFTMKFLCNIISLLIFPWLQHINWKYALWNGTTNERLSHFYLFNFFCVCLFLLFLNLIPLNVERTQRLLY